MHIQRWQLECIASGVSNMHAVRCCYRTSHTGFTIRFMYSTQIVGWVARSVQRPATGWTVWGSNPGVGEIFRTCPDWPWGPPSLLYNGY
jgi:hypothetical protein